MHARIRKLPREAWQRVRASWFPVALAAVAAALAWLFAHRVLGHPQPFFAPIAATIALSTSRIQRSRRTAQMIVGVLLGIGISEALVAALGTSTVAVGVTVFATLLAALILGVGIFGEGMMFANQAAASAILVVTLHRHGAGGERVIDAIVGGTFAVILGVLLFPAHPLSILRDGERAVLRTLATTLERVAERMSVNAPPDDLWALRAGSQIHRQLGVLARAQSTARANVRIAPRRWGLRAAVAAESERTTRLELLANAVLGLVRAATTEIHGGERIADHIQQRVTVLARAIRRLADTSQPWPDRLRVEVGELADSMIAGAEQREPGRDAIAAAIIRAAAADLSHVIDGPAYGAPERAACHSV